MKRNDEDRLIELAFGELTAEEAEQLRSEANGDNRLADTLRCYSEMREGLQSLRDVPAMQMSCDRLRDAILAGGLKQPKAPAWTWLGVPAALAAAAFIITLAVRKPALPLPSGDLVAQSSMDPILDTRIDTAISPFGQFKIDAPKRSAAGPVVKEAQPQPKRESIRNRGADMRVARADESELDPTRFFSKTPAGPSPMVSTAAAVSDQTKGMEAEAAPPVESATLIVIEPEQNLDTGARKAVEVQSVSNVVIGG